MRKIQIIVFLFWFISIACNSSKRTASTNQISTLNGTWELYYITGPRIAFDGLYPDKKPTLTFDVTNNTVGGHSSCNSFNGTLNADGPRISFTEPMAMTKMFCPGNGESVFMETLKKVNLWSLSAPDTLRLLKDDISMMGFVKK